MIQHSQNQQKRTWQKRLFLCYYLHRRRVIEGGSTPNLEYRGSLSNSLGWVLLCSPAPFIFRKSLQIKSQAPNRTCCKKIWQKGEEKKCSTNKPPQSAGLKREKGSDVRGMLSGWWEWDLLTGECPARQNNLAA